MPTPKRPSRFTLPLLAKELAEQSARPRTYIVRTAYALVFYTVTLWGFYQQVGDHWSRGDLGMLGTGAQLFSQVLMTQYAAIFLVLPALMAGVITAEKEKDTLGLLLITKLRPRTIVLEKFLSRVIPMLLYLSLSLPLLGVAYSLGGVESGSVYFAGLSLMIAVLQVGTVGVFCSVWFRTTAQALIATYAFCPLCALVTTGLGRSAFPTASMPTFAASLSLGIIVLLCLGVLPAAGGLAFASAMLWDRAFLQPRNRLLKLLQALDQFFHKLNQNSVTKGIVLLNDRMALPEYAPIAWKETQKRSMGTLRYLVRLLLFIEVPLLFLLLLPLTENIAWERGTRVLDFGDTVVWWIAIFAVLSSATGLISGERARQTLDVLLSTPMSARQIMQEKFAGVQRLIYVLWVPLGTVFAFRLWWLATVRGVWQDFDQIAFTITSLASALVYLPLIGWVGVHASLRFRSQMAAMTAALTVVLGVAGLPWLVDWFGVLRYNVSSDSERLHDLLILLFPNTGSVIDLRQSDWMYFVLLAHFVLYGVLVVQLRRWGASELIRLSGRCENRGLAGVRERHLRPAID